MSFKSFELDFNYFTAQKRLTLLFVFFVIIANPAKSESIQEFNNRVEAKKTEAYRQFQNQWHSYLKRETNLPNELSQNFIQPSWARKVTEEFLKQSGGLKARFADASIKNRYSFSFLRPADETDRKAGFHRALKSIFIDIQDLNSNQWLMYFVHEVAHSLDSELFDSLAIFNDRTLRSTLEELGRKKVKLSDLRSEQRIQLDQWLIAGLNRGFFAEYRAWLLTLKIYQEGLRDGIFQQIPWLEDLKNSLPPSESEHIYVYRYLSESWVDPTDELFSFEFIQDALREVRKRHFDNPSLVKMGQIGAILHSK